MIASKPYAAAVCLLLLAGPVHAACSDEIQGVEQHVDAVGRKAGAATSSGQATSAQRGEKAKETRAAGVPAAQLPDPPSSGNVAATQQAAQAGAGGDRVMQAKVALNDAKNAMRKGDEAACADAVRKAKSLVD